VLSAPGTPDTFGLLDRFGQELHPCRDHPTGARLLLGVTRQLTRAVAVFITGPGGSALQIATPPLEPEWCRDLVHRVLRSAPAGKGELLRPHWTRSSLALPDDPPALALVRLSRSEEVWLAALAGPGTALGVAELKALVLARRIFLNHHRQSRARDLLQDALFGLIQSLTAALEAKDPYTCGHSSRVARIGARVARQMGLPERAVSDIYLTGLLHDIGKIGIRDGILLKPGALSAEEMDHVREHTVIGDRIVSNVRQLEHIRPGVRGHHERWDGGGYPDRLAGPAIPLPARILAVADGCDAMMADRPYRPAMPPGRVDEVMRAGAGSQWDPDVVKHFLACSGDVYPICQRSTGESIVLAVAHVVAAGEAGPVSGGCGWPGA
jgi:hypothetical protein